MSERPDTTAVATTGAAELRTVLETLTDGVQVFDATGRMVSCNAAAARLYELEGMAPTLAAILAKWDVLDEDGTPIPPHARPLATAMRTGKAAEGVAVGLRRVVDGSVRWLSVSTSPIHETDGTVSGFVSCTRDLTERVDTIRALRILTEAAGRLSSSLVPDEVVTALTEAA